MTSQQRFAEPTSSAAPVGRISHVSLRTPQLDAMVHHYTTVLGLTDVGGSGSPTPASACGPSSSDTSPARSTSSTRSWASTIVELFTELDRMSDEGAGVFDWRPWHDGPQHPRRWDAHAASNNPWGILPPDKFLF